MLLIKDVKICTEPKSKPAAKVWADQSTKVAFLKRRQQKKTVILNVREWVENSFEKINYDKKN